MDVEAIQRLLAHNEAIAERFFEIEKRILTISDYTDLFEVLLNQIKDQFEVPYAWITIIEKSEVSRLIHSVENSANLRHRLNVVSKDTYDRLVGRAITPLLINHRVEAYGPLLPPDRQMPIQSLAIAPLTLGGDVIGSLNQADRSHTRFQPGIDTSLLERLAIKVSLCLSNVTAHEKLRYLAYHDPLTGLLNRRVMEAILARECRRKNRYPHPLAVVFVDLDRFKQVNDRYGHDRGDDLLVHAADCLLKLSRETDVVARFAGDEFVIILPETSKIRAMNLMDRIQSYLRDHPLVLPDGATVEVSFSFGVASTEEGGRNEPEALLKKADQRLYLQKKAKKKALSMQQGRL